MFLRSLHKSVVHGIAKTHCVSCVRMITVIKRVLYHSNNIANMKTESNFLAAKEGAKMLGYFERSSIGNRRAPRA